MLCSSIFVTDRSSQLRTTIREGLFKVCTLRIPLMVKRKQAIGILGMAFAVAGGIAWFFRQTFVAVMLWGVAGLILLKLSKRKKNYG